MGVVSGSNHPKSASRVSTVRHRLPETQAAPCILYELVRIPYTKAYFAASQRKPLASETNSYLTARRWVDNVESREKHHFSTYDANFMKKVSCEGNNT